MNLIALGRKLFMKPTREPLVIYANMYAVHGNQAYLRYHPTKEAALKAAHNCPAKCLIFKARKFIEAPE